MLGVWQFVKGGLISEQYIIIITDCPNKTKEIVGSLHSAALS